MAYAVAWITDFHSSLCFQNVVQLHRARVNVVSYTATTKSPAQNFVEVKND
jgi:hypothetical protein